MAASTFQSTFVFNALGSVEPVGFSQRYSWRWQQARVKAFVVVVAVTSWCCASIFPTGVTAQAAPALLSAQLQLSVSSQ